jgi:RNA polymerase sigma factor (sigma-70 family)
MARFRVDSIAGLARQMLFAPVDIRAGQVASAETLLHALDIAKAYPLDFVIFRITGYHPKTTVSDLLTGLALQHDLGLLIEQVSESLDQRSDELLEPVLAIDDVTEKFNVTSKTIQRWRRRGLPARRFIFPDGKRRVGFLLSSVERFLSAHGEQVARGANFSQVEDGERERILRCAQRLATRCSCCRNEISRRLGRKFNRSPLTILHTIKKHDDEHPDAAIFPASPAPVSDEERTQIIRGYRRGLALDVLGRRVCRPRSAVYRVLVDERLARLQKRRVKFIDDPLYHQDDAERAIDAIASQRPLAAVPTGEQARVPKGLPPLLQALYREPLLTPTEERGLFLKFNFQKYQFLTARRRLDDRFVKHRDLLAVEAHLRKASETKNRIVRANLRLVVSIARRHLRPGVNLMELVSEGSLTLMRAVDGFDVHKGNRFSTYATLALMKGFARSVPEILSHRRGTSAAPEFLGELADARSTTATDSFINREQLHKLLSHLGTHERAVLHAHFGLGDRTEPATYQQVGRQLGISLRQVRQLEQRALAKMRAAAGINN